MPTDSEKQQIGIRLSVKMVRIVDELRGNRNRAEFCRELIEAGLTKSEPLSVEVLQPVAESLECLQEQITKTHQAAVLTQHDIGKTIDVVERLYSAVATAFVGVLTKIGQMVRQEDQQIFAREKAEQFVKRIFYPDDFPQDDAK